MRISVNWGADLKMSGFFARRVVPGRSLPLTGPVRRLGSRIMGSFRTHLSEPSAVLVHPRWRSIESCPGPHPRPGAGPPDVVNFPWIMAGSWSWDKSQNQSQCHSRPPRVRTLKCPVRVRTPGRALGPPARSVSPGSWPVAGPGIRAKTSRSAIPDQPGCGP